MQPAESRQEYSSEGPESGKAGPYSQEYTQQQHQTAVRLQDNATNASYWSGSGAGLSNPQVSFQLRQACSRPHEQT